jgi:tetratricopeptide (TPR) repeat protein
MTALGRSEEGLAQTDHGIALYEGLKTPPVFWPLLLSVRAVGLALAGRPADALDLIDESIEMTGESNILFPEFALLKGDLLLALSDADGAESYFRRAFEFAGDLGARMPELRAATRLTRLRRAAGNSRTRTTCCAGSTRRSPKASILRISWRPAPCSSRWTLE